MVDLSVSQMETIYSERQLEELSRQNVQHARQRAWYKRNGSRNQRVVSGRGKVERGKGWL